MEEKETLDIDYIKTLYLEGYNSEEISSFTSNKAETLKEIIDKDLNEYKHIHIIKSKLRNDNMNHSSQLRSTILNLYVEGTSPKKIASKLNKSTTSVYTYISRNLKDYKSLHKENKHKKIKTLYEEGYIPSEIACKIDEKVDTVRNQIYKNFKESRAIHLENREKRPNDKIKELYCKGYTISEISKILNVKRDNVKNHFYRNLTEYRSDHEEARKLNNEIKKLVQKECKNYISDHALLKINRQSYVYDKNNDLVYNDKRCGEIPSGLPRKYKNEVL
nr:hypothetical protein [Clostridioides sp.]